MASRLQDVILRGTRAAQPLANAVAVGTLYFVTDESTIERSNGTIWESYSSVGTAITALTGDVTAAGPGAVAATIAADAVTYAKMQNVSATARILARKTAGAGNVEEATLSEILDFIGSAAQGDILYRDAAAWVRLAAGTSGFYLKTQGAGANPIWAAVGAASGGLSTATLVLTDAQIKSLNTVPVQIIAAPGANKYTVVLGCFVVKDTSAGVYSAATNFSLRYSGVAVDLTAPMNLFQASANYRWQIAAIANVGNTANDTNKAVVAYQAADITGGNVANYYKIIATYTIFDVA